MHRAIRRSGIAALLVALLAAVAAPLLPPAPAHAESIVTNILSEDGLTSGYYTIGETSPAPEGLDNIFYVYAKAGEWLQLWGAYSSTTAATATVTAPDGTTWTYGYTTEQFRTPFQVTAATEGIWEVHFDTGTTTQRAKRWSVDVYPSEPVLSTGTWLTYSPLTDSANVSPARLHGRVWSENYMVRHDDDADTNTLRFYLINDQGYLYRVTLDQYNGLNSAIVATSIGMPEGGVGSASCTPSYQSWEMPGAATVQPPDAPCATYFRIFFEEPDDDLPVSAKIWRDGAQQDQLIKPEPLDPYAASVGGWSFSGDGVRPLSGELRYTLGGALGVHTLAIDANGDGDYDDAVDRRVELRADGGPVAYDFDGLDGEGNPIVSCTPVKARVSFERVGEIHLVQADVEQRGSLEMIRLNGPGAPDATIHWDDTTSALNEARTNTTSVLDGTAGVDSTGGVHGWGKDAAWTGNGWGNERWIDDWAYLPAAHVVGEAVIAQPGCADSPSLSVSVDSSHTTGLGGHSDLPDAGTDQAVFTYTITNNGDVPVTDVTLDPVAGGVLSCTPTLPVATLAANATVVCTETVTLTQALIDGGVVTAAGVIANGKHDGTPVASPPVSDTEPLERQGVLALDITGAERTDTNSDGFADPGEPIAYEYTVTNTGNVTVSGLAVHPALGGTNGGSAHSCPVAVLAPGASTVCTGATYPVTSGDITAGSVEESANATGTDPMSGAVTSNTDTQGTPLTKAEPSISISVSGVVDASHGHSSTVPDAGADTATFTYAVTNNGNAPLTDVTLDPRFTGSEFQCSPALPVATLAPAATITCTETVVLAQADISSGSIGTGTVTVTGTWAGGPVTDDDDDTQALVQAKTLLLDITRAEWVDAGTDYQSEPGELVEYEYTVTNTGNVPLTGVGVTPTRGGTNGGTTVSCVLTGLDPGESTTCTADYPITAGDITAGTVAESAVAAGTFSAAPVTSNTDTATTSLVAASVAPTADKEPTVSERQVDDDGDPSTPAVPVDAVEFNPVADGDQGELVVTAPPGSTVTYRLTYETTGAEMFHGGGWSTTATPDQYALLFPTSLAPGAYKVLVHVEYPNGTSANLETWIYIDPSGHVLDDAGAAVAGATVTLWRAADGGLDGSGNAICTGLSFPADFTVVPDGSTVMSPANRQNPVTTGASGAFAWDVSQGCYVVVAEKTVGATTYRNQTAILPVPPIQTDLVIVLHGLVATAATTTGGTLPQTGGAGWGIGLGGVLALLAGSAVLAGVRRTRDR